MLQRSRSPRRSSTRRLTIKASRIDSDSSDSHVFPAGRLVISTRQPLGGSRGPPSERSPVFTKGYVEEQQKRAHADDTDEFYDRIRGRLPLAMNVEDLT